MSKDINALEFIDKLVDGKITPGRVVKARRETLGLTQKDVSEITGLKTTFISAVENDRRNIGIQTASKLAAALGLHPSSILFPEGINLGKDFEKIVKKRIKILKRKAA